LRGCAWPAGGGVSYPRFDTGPLGLRLPADTRASASLPIGVRFVFEGEPDSIELDYVTETDELGPRGEGAGRCFVAYRGEERIDAAEARKGEGRVALRVGAGEEPVAIYLPEGMKPTVRALRPRGGEIRPGSPERRWICYGDSIAEGWCASEPSTSWPSRVSRRHGLDVVNLGFAGSARGEAATAQEIAALPADLISIAHGTNCWTRTPQSAECFAASLRDFVALVRLGHPQTPIVAVSPILRADAESQPNVLGATLLDLRMAFETTIESLRASGDARLQLVEGHDLVSAERFSDGIHPDDAGHAQMADRLGPILVAALGRGAPAG
jgi:lysophospholipase L1-like esterase